MQGAKKTQCNGKIWQAVTTCRPKDVLALQSFSPARKTICFLNFAHSQILLQKAVTCVIRRVTHRYTVYSHFCYFLSLYPGQSSVLWFKLNQKVKTVLALKKWCSTLI